MRDPNTNYLFGSAQSARIQAAEQLFDPGTECVLAAIPFERSGVAFEVGAGGGSIARWLCGVMTGEGRVVASDIDTDLLEAMDRPPALEIWKHDVVDDALEAGQFDLIHARLLLEHLPTRDAVLRRLVQALRPGGWIVVEDVDYAGAVPVSDLGSALHARVQDVRLREFAASGIDHYYGRALPERLRAAGLEHVNHDGRTWIMEGGSAGARWLKLSLAHLRGRLVGPEKLSDPELDEMLELLDNPGWAALAPIMFAVWGQKHPLAA